MCVCECARVLVCVRGEREISVSDFGGHVFTVFKISKGLLYPFDHPLPLLLGPVAQLETAAGRAFSYTF